MRAVITRTVKLHPIQAAFRRSDALYRGFVGGRGSGKSWVGAYDLIRRARRGRTYLVGSPTGVLMGDTTFPTFKELAQGLGVWGSAKLTPYPNVQLTTGATIRFRTAEDPEKMRGPNLSGAWLDEASLMDVGAFQIIIPALREAGEQGWLSATFTPKGQQHWTYATFGTGRPDSALFHARTRDNPFNPPGFEDTLRRQYPEILARQELAGEFCDLDGDAWQVVPTAWVQAAMARWTPAGRHPASLSCIGVDVARGGAAQTVLARRYLSWFAPLERHPGRTTPDGPAVVGLIALALRENPEALVNVDVIGVGASVFDGCRANGWYCMGVNFAGVIEALDRAGVLRFANNRAFAYWGMRELLDPANGHNVQLPPDDELLADLTAPRWKMTVRGVLIESKEDIAKRIGRSTDCGDAVILATLLPPPSV
jgi:hypothetical protein